MNVMLQDTPLKKTSCSTEFVYYMHMLCCIPKLDVIKHERLASFQTTFFLQGKTLHNDFGSNLPYRVKATEK